MKHLLRTGVLVVALLALIASASAPKRHTFEKSRLTPASYDAAWAAVIDVFADSNWAIENMEKDSGLITTDWMSIGTDSSFADCGGAGIASREDRQIRFNVLVRELAEGARVTVNASVRELRRFDNSRSTVDCSSTGQVEALIHGRVDDAIAADARRTRRARDTSRGRASRTGGEASSNGEASSDDDAPSTGAERGACYGNQTCNAGLECDPIEQTCVAASEP